MNFTKLSFLIAGIAVLLLGLTFIKSNRDSTGASQQTNTTAELGEVLRLSYPVEVEDMLPSALNPFDRIKARSMVAFVLSPSVCSGCILEAGEYIQLIQNEYASYGYQPVVIVATPDSAQAARYAQRTSFEVPVYYGGHEELKQLSYTGDSPIRLPAQLIVFYSQGRVVRRSILSNSLTPPASKRLLLDQVLAARESTAMEAP